MPKIKTNGRRRHEYPGVKRRFGAKKTEGRNLLFAVSAGTDCAGALSACGIEHIPHHVVVWGCIYLIVPAARYPQLVLSSCHHDSGSGHREANTLQEELRL